MGQLSRIQTPALGNSGAELGMRNRIINGAMAIDQRNAGASVTPGDGSYTLDRWKASVTQAGKLSMQQVSAAPSGFINSVLVTSLAATTVGTGDTFGFYQPIEGLNISDLGFGAAGAATITVSFWVRASITGTYSVSITNSGLSRCYPVIYTVNAANTWEQKIITIAGDTAGTWLTTNGVGLQLFFNLGAGSTYGGAISGAWVGSLKVAATGQTNWISTNGATFYITGVQLEKGNNASPFEWRPYGQELALCYRYYRRYTGAGQMIGAGGWFNTTTAYRWGFTLDTPMRTAPTVSFNSCQGWGGNALGGTVSASTNYSTTNNIDCDITLSSAMGTASAFSVFKMYLVGVSPFIELNGAEL